MEAAKPAVTQRLWGARFRAEPAPALKALSRSEASHFRLVPYDLAGSRAHARELQRAGILDEMELARLLETIDALAREHAAGTLHPSPADEDVHTFLERCLTERLGELGGKIRAGRSRNDQAANDLRLYLRDHARRVALGTLELLRALAAQAQAHERSWCPGFTHLQPAQPIVFGHLLLAHAQALSRDVERLRDWDRRSARSPLGAAALAGSAVCRSPELSAREMGYDAPCENSIDAVGARDHVAEFLFATSMLAVHVSRLAEEVVLWCSKAFAWVELDDAWCTGSSIMPQKKNPDIAELARGKAGRLIGHLMTMLATLKSLPLAYNRDLIEDKAAAFDAVDTLALVLPAMTGLVGTMRVDVRRLAEQAPLGFTLATEVADWLSFAGVPFAQAHEITGTLVKACEAHGIELGAVTPELLAEVDPRLKPELRARLNVQAAVEARSGFGGTAPARVREQLERMAALLDAQQAWAGAYEGPRC